MKTLLNILFVLLLSVTISAGSEVMMQGFHWESHSAKYFSTSWWDIMHEKAEDIAEAGIDYIWFPPSAKSAAVEGYLPSEYYIQDSGYGTSSELRKCIQQFHKYGVKTIADIVINHRVGTTDWADFTNPTWGTDAVCGNDEWWGATGNHDTGVGYHAARDIDHTQDYVRKSIINYMNMLQNEYGYDGYRYDFVKGFHGSFVKFYNNSTNPTFSVGEYWEDLDINDPNSNRQEIVNWIDQTEGASKAFDFTTKGMLQHVVTSNEYYRLRDDQGKPCGVIGWWPEKSVTFIDNHDTGPSTGGNGGQSHWPFPADKLLLGYTDIMKNPGTPSVYWVHFFNWGEYNREMITKLIKLRKENNITDTSKVDIKAADNSKYAAIIDNKIAMMIGHGDWNPGEGWDIFVSGQDFAVWVK